MKKMLGLSLLLILLSLVLIDVPALAKTNGTDSETPSTGNILVGIKGEYEYVDKDKILDRVNEIRKEACNKGYINPSTGKSLTKKDYVPIKWSSDLEWIAQIRAAECVVNESHTRPNGTSCFTLKYNENQSWGENLAWNYSGLMEGIEQWYGEKSDWVEQNTGRVTGHYEGLINPKYEYIGMGCFKRSSGGWFGVSGEFSSYEGSSEDKSKLKGKVTQMIEVTKDSAGKINISAPKSLKKNGKGTISAYYNINYQGIMGGTNSSNGLIMKDLSFKSSNKSIITVDGKGKIKANKEGKAFITVKLNKKKVGKVQIQVQ